MGRRAVDRPFRVNLEFNGPNKDSESRVFGEVFRACFGTPIDRRTKRGRMLYSAAKAIVGMIELDTSARAKAKQPRERRSHA